MNNNILSMDLVQKCVALVRRIHKTDGFGNLPARITTKDNIIALGCMAYTMVFMKSASSVYKIRKFCWLIGIAIIVLAWIFNWWILLGLIAVYIADLLLASEEIKFWLCLSAALLALEMLTNDFAGWGKAYPEEREKALNILGDKSENPRNTWLDFYLPRRPELAPSLLKDFGPN